MYLDKTEERIKTLADQSDFWKELILSEEITYNGKHLKNIPYLSSIIQAKVEQLVNETVGVFFAH